MTVDEIKQRYTMSDILMRYNIQSKGTRKNISCPFHGKDKNPSMQIFKDGFNCHTCGKHGDIFVFVQEMENCSFKEAFLTLGGTYENTKEDFSAKLRLERLKREREKRVQADLRQKRFKHDISNLITFYRSVCDKYEPLSGIWCAAQNNLFELTLAWEEKYIKREEVDIRGIISRHSKSEFAGNFIR